MGKSGRVYTPLPIDAALGFPLSFPYFFGGQTYRFTFYVNVPADALTDTTTTLPLDENGEAILVARVERDRADGTPDIILLRRVVPHVEYLAEELALLVLEQRVVRRNLNGQGNFGSVVRAGIAARWA